MEEIPIRGEMIRLGQLLKLAGAAGAGSEAKALLTAGAVAVNGALESRRGRQLHPGDVVEVGPARWKVIGGDGADRGPPLGGLQDVEQRRRSGRAEL